MINKAEVVARGVQEYINKGIFSLKIIASQWTAKRKPMIKSMLLQGKEINGLIPLDKGRYHNLFYENLIKKLSKLRLEYRLFL